VARELSSSVVLVRHGETAWSRVRRHTGHSDVPLTERGQREAEAVGRQLADRQFSLVLTSPSSRASETCRLAGFGAAAQERDDLLERDYGVYEGLTTAEIREKEPGWNVWTADLVGGETIAQVATRADRVLAELRAASGNGLVFSHGHLLRVLAARWLGLDGSAGALFALDPATVSVLGYENDGAVLRTWNGRCEVV
jgi:broad specificity phosphatase PhoE